MRAARRAAIPAADGPSSSVAALVQRAGPLAAAGLVSNGMAVVLTVALARLLDPQDYGAYASLMATALILYIPGSALLVAVVRHTSGLVSAGLGARVDPWAARVRRLALAGCGVLAVVAVAMRGVLADTLSLPGPGGSAEVVLAGGAWALLGIERGLLQTRRAYGALGRNLLLEGAARCLLTLAFVVAGAGVAGTAWGLLGANLLATAYGRRALRSGTRPAGPDEPVPGRRADGRSRVALDAVVALAVLGLLTVLQSLDVIIVGREAPARSGAWAAISVTSKALVFVALALSQYVVAETARRWHDGDRGLRQLAAALVLFALPALGLLAVSMVAAEPALRLVFGPDLAGGAPQLTTLVAATTCLGAAVLLAHYLLAAGRREVVAALLVAAVVVAGALSLAGGRPAATANTLLACHAGLAAVLAGLVVRASRSRRPSR